MAEVDPRNLSSWFQPYRHAWYALPMVVAVPLTLALLINRLPLAYPVGRHDLEMTRYLTTWVDLRRKDGTIETFYEHWILRRDAALRKPRWSILRNVLQAGTRPHAGS